MTVPSCCHFLLGKSICQQGHFHGVMLGYVKVVFVLALVLGSDQGEQGPRMCSLWCSICLLLGAGMECLRTGLFFLKYRTKEGTRELGGDLSAVQ